MTVTEIACLLRATHERQLLLVVSPAGPLSHAIDAYRQAVAVRIGANAAHDVAPRAVLARLSDGGIATHDCRRLLEAAIATHRDRLVSPGATVTIRISPTWHGLEIESRLFDAFVDDFAARASGRVFVASAGRFRLTLAAGFDQSDHDALSELAHRIIDPTLAATWDVGLVRANDRVPVFVGSSCS